MAATEHPPQPQYHPKKDKHGKPVLIQRSHRATARSTWNDPDAVATFLPGGDAPREINGVPLAPRRDHPATAED